MKHSIGISLTAAVATTVLTVPLGYVAEVSYMYFYNSTASAKTVVAYWEHAHNAAHQIPFVSGASLAATASLQLTELSVILNPGDSLVVTPEAGATMSIIITFDLRKEIFPLTFVGE
tara:strand:- start:2275 stop:2625 length:351 start_codon:yes stop_codon:yes gene_type:complete